MTNKMFRCPQCGQIKPLPDYRQIFCSRECVNNARAVRTNAEFRAFVDAIKNQRLAENQALKDKPSDVCKVESCKMYKENLGNHCNALRDVISKDCPFYKPKQA